MRGEYRVRFVENGVLVTDEDGLEFSYQESGESRSDLERWCELLYALTEHVGFSGSKRDLERIYINVHPGWDTEEFYEKECPICWSIPKSEY